MLEAVRSYVSLSEEECDALFERLNRRLRLDEREHETARERERLRTELDRVQRLVAQLYEDRLAGKIGETNFYPLLERYEQKTAELQRQIGAMETGDSADDLRAQQERLRAVIRRYQDIDELTPSLLFELIERIEVGQGTYEKTAEGKVKRQRISIQFRFLPEPCEFDWTE